MGRILDVHCEKCGFNKTLFLGGSRMDCNTETILSALPENKRDLLENAISRGAKWISIDRRLAICEACGELIALPVVAYTLDEQRMELRGVCPNCGGDRCIERAEQDTLPCLHCNADLTLLSAGHWD